MSVEIGYMNPNGQNQRWSKWVWFVKPGRTLQRDFQTVQVNCARFGKKAFGLATEMRIQQNKNGYLIEVITEGSPVHDALFRDYMEACWLRFFRNGFGLSTSVKMTAKLMAGSRQDGTPAEQMLIMPVIRDTALNMALNKIAPYIGG